MTDLNNKNLNTESNGIRRNSMLKKYIWNKLITNQKILRYIKYTTKSPLLPKSKNFDNEEVIQPDLTKKDVEGLISFLPFNPDMEISLNHYIFENIYAGNFENGSYVNITISVLTEARFEDISDGMRGSCIAQEIANIFTDMCVDEEEWVRDLGNIKFKFISHDEIRLSKSNNYILNRLVFRVNYVPINRVRVKL